MQPLEGVFRFSEIAGIGHTRTIAVRQAGLQAYINAYLRSRRDVVKATFRLHRELYIVAICAFEEPRPLNLLDRERFDGTCPHETHGANACPVGERSEERRVGKECRARWSP